MAEMTLLEAARYLETGGSEAVVLLEKAARVVMQHAGDMKKLDQERLAKETLLEEACERIDAVKLSAIAENKNRIEDAKFIIEKNKQTLLKSQEEIKPTLEELASLKEQVENTTDILRETIFENDRIAAKSVSDLKEAQNKLAQVKEAIKQAKVDIGAL